MTNNQRIVLRFLFENIDGPLVRRAVESVTSGKYFAKETSLLRRAQSHDLSYATVRQIAESTDLNPSTVRSLIKKLRQLGAIIESEQMWGTSAEEDIDGFDLVSADEAERRLHADIGAGPLGLLHKLNPESRSRIMSTSAGEQLTLQFPPFEKTFLIVRSHLREKVHR